MRSLVVVVLAACGRIGFDEAAELAPEPLAATPAFDRANVNSSVAITVTGGVPPYDFAVEGDGAIANSVYRSASRAGTARITITDAEGATTEVTITTAGASLFGVGGYTATDAFSDVYRSDDAITWTRIGDLPQALGGGFLWVQDDALHWAGGDKLFDGNMQSSQVYRSRDGITWEAIGTLPVGIAAAHSTWFEGRIWIGPGTHATNSYNTDVWSSADGIAWRAEPTFPIQVHMNRLLEFGGALYSIAGHEVNAQIADVFKLTAGTWQMIGALENAGEYHSTAVYAGKMWAGGGLGLGDIVQTSVDGVTWTRTAARMPLGREEGEFVEWNATLYMFAGRPRQTFYTTDGTSWTAAGAYPLDCVGTHVVAFTPR